jgi:hypothetical protein
MNLFVVTSAVLAFIFFCSRAARTAPISAQTWRFFSEMVVWTAPISTLLKLKGIGTAMLQLMGIGTVPLTRENK